MTNTTNTTTAEVVDITPTWGEFAALYRRLAEGGELMAIKELAAELAKMAAAAAALNAIKMTLTDAQQEVVSKTIIAELAKQGI